MTDIRAEMNCRVANDERFVFFLKRWNDLLDSISENPDKTEYMNSILLVTLSTIKKINVEAWNEIKKVIDES